MSNIYLYAFLIALLGDAFFVVWMFFLSIKYNLPIGLVSFLAIATLVSFALLVIAHSVHAQEPLCLRLNNPMCVAAMPESDPWEGQIGKTKENLARFKTYEHGLRAGFIVLTQYHFKHGINTLEKLTRRWCEANQKEYAAFIADKLGVTPRQKINLLAHIPAIMQAIIHYENGKQPFPVSKFEQFEMYGK